MDPATIAMLIQLGLSIYNATQNKGGEGGGGGAGGGGFGNLLGGLGGGGGGQPQQIANPNQPPIVPPKLEPYQPPSYGNIISEMLKRQRGF